MKKGSGPLNTPMQHCPASPKTSGTAGIYDHHPTKEFSKPRDGGNELPEKFFENIKGTPATVSTPMNFNDTNPNSLKPSKK